MKQNSSPLSPHISIYRPQITSVLSIMHRITGIFLFIGLAFILWWVIFCIHYYDPVISSCLSSLDSVASIDASGNLLLVVGRSVYGKMILIPWSYCLFYHLCAGIRHLFWDVGVGFDVKAVAISGWCVVIISLLLTLVCWYYALT